MKDLGSRRGWRLTENCRVCLPELGGPGMGGSGREAVLSSLRGQPGARGHRFHGHHVLDSFWHAWEAGTLEIHFTDEGTGSCPRPVPEVGARSGCSGILRLQKGKPSGVTPLLGAFLRALPITPASSPLTSAPHNGSFQLSSLWAFVLALPSWNTLPPSSTQLETFMHLQQSGQGEKEPEKTVGARRASRASQAPWTMGASQGPFSLWDNEVGSRVTSFNNVLNRSIKCIQVWNFSGQLNKLT